MQTRQLGFALVGIVILVIGFVVGLRFQTSPPSTRNPKDRLITISAAGTGKCEVDFPVALLHYDHTVQWASNDNQYWISFLTIDAPADTHRKIRSFPLTNPQLSRRMASQRNTT